MRFTCDKCHGEYQANQGSAVAHLYIKDRRCNHLEARCSNCGITEVIFLGPSRIEEAIRVGHVAPIVHVEADGELRVRAERAWRAVEQPGAPQAEPQAEPQSGPDSAGPAPPATVTTTEGDTLRRYQLNQRHERLIASFGETLANIPDDLLWDGIQSEHDPRHPERWTD